MGTYNKPVTRINHIHATGINFSLQLFSATIMIFSGAFLLTLFVLSGAKVMGTGKGFPNKLAFKDKSGKGLFIKLLQKRKTMEDDGRKWKTMDENGKSDGSQTEC